MRLWFSGPRILDGLVRPGISFSLSELKRKVSRQPLQPEGHRLSAHERDTPCRSAASDPASALEPKACSGAPPPSALQPEGRRLSVGPAAWLVSALAGYGAWSLIDVFSKGRHELFFAGFLIVAALAIMTHAIRRQRVFLALSCAILLAIGLLLFAALAVAPAHAGTCRVYSDGELGVTRCDNGSVTVQYPDGRRVEYGAEPNAGFERYPGQPPAPAYPRREGE